MTINEIETETKSTKELDLLVSVIEELVPSILCFTRAAERASIAQGPTLPAISHIRYQGIE